jgi:hypothetical protein
MSLFIQYRGDDFKVDYNPKKKDLNFAIKVLTVKNSLGDLSLPVENKTLLKFAHLKSYLKAEGFFEEYFSQEEENY